MLLALSSNQKLGLALVAAVFVGFALLSAVVIPRANPDFPERRLNLFIGVSVLLTVAMLATVVFVARESGEESQAATTTQTTGTETSATETTPTETATTTAPAVPKGDPAAGKQLFAAQACGGCHTLSAAGSKGQAGPNLDKVAADARTAKAPSVAEYVFTSIEDPNAYIVPGFQANVMPNFGQILKKQQIADLVAFITSGS